MRKVYLFILLLFLIQIPAQAFQDCVLIGDGKLTDISIEHNDIIDVYPMVTIMNEKNTLFVVPLKVGETKFSVLKNKKTKYVFSVSVTDEETKISNVDGFESFVIDEPVIEENPYDDLDLPPEVKL